MGDEIGEISGRSDTVMLILNNYRFEHLGDTVLGLAVTSLMLDMFPGLRVGPATVRCSLSIGQMSSALISLYLSRKSGR